MNATSFKRINYLALPEKPTELETLPAPLSVTWQTLTDTFLADYRGATQRTYRDAWTRFLAFCEVSNQDPVTQVPDEDTVKAYRDSLLDTEHSPHTINAYLAAIRAFYRFLHGYVRKALRTGKLAAGRACDLARR